MVVEVVERALAHTNKNEVLLVGGVGANIRLQEMLSLMCNDRNCSFHVPETKYLGDNGSMIAYTGLLMYNCNEFTSIENSFIDASFRPDSMNIEWKINPYIIKKDEFEILDGAEAKITIITLNNKK